MASSGLLDLDPTGTLSAVGAGVSLVGAALRLGTAAKKFQDARHGGGGGAISGGGGGGASGAAAGPSQLHRSQTTPGEIPTTPKDPERERRAYETVNFVLREFGSRICAAGMVDEHALTKALTAATQHIEVNLFSGETNRLFESLAPKLADPILVNSVFTSIYFIGALTAELSSSLPNYKDTYVPVGPRLVQQLFRAAIGEDAFKDNLRANLDAYNTLTLTAGLLRPTDIGYLTFPRFPSFAPSRFSSRSLTETHRNRSTFEKLVRHFEKVGFPQPNPVRQAEVGLIRDWKFLSGESNSRSFDVDKADRNIGENFGRVLYWLICSAERLPPGQAVIAYYEHHIELIQWIQHRMGFAVLYPAIDLNLGGLHAQLDRKLRSAIDSWVILMPSAAAQAAKRANADHWMATHLRTVAQAPPLMAATNTSTRPPSMAVPQTNVGLQSAGSSPPPNRYAPSIMNQAGPSAAQGIPPVATQGPSPMRHPSQASSHAPSMVSLPLSTNRSSTVEATPPTTRTTGSPPTSPLPVELPTLGDVQPAPKTVEQQVEEIHQHFKSALVPQFQRLWSQPSLDPGIRDSQCTVLAHTVERETIDRLDRVQISANDRARLQRKSLIDQAQELLDFLPIYKDLGPNAMHGRPLPGALQIHALETTTNAATPSRPPSELPQNTGSSPPPYSPTSLPSAKPPAEVAASNVFEKPATTTIRRKAPPPPKKTILAKALYDFEPETGNEEELGFKEDDEIEIIEKNAAMEEDGWCRARVKGSKRIGLVPLEYLELAEKKPASVTGPSKPPSQEAATHSTLPLHNTPASHHTPMASSAPSSQSAPVSHNAASLHQTTGPHVATMPQTTSGTGPSNAPASIHIDATSPQVNTPAHHQPATSNIPTSAYQNTVINVSQPIEPNLAQIALQAPQKPSPDSHMSKFQAASLATAAVGAATHVGDLIEGAHGHDSKYSHGSYGNGGQQERPESHTNEQDSRASGDSAGPMQALGGTSNNNQENNQSAIGDQVGAAPDGNEVATEQDSPPMVDLSAFGEAPFDPQSSVAPPTAFGSEQYYIPQEVFTGQTTEADFVGAPVTSDTGNTTATETGQDATSTTFVDDPAVATSPFASLATTSASNETSAISIDATVNNGDGTTTSTYETFTDVQTPFTTDINNGGTMAASDQSQWNSGVVDNDDDYDASY